MNRLLLRTFVALFLAVASANNAAWAITGVWDGGTGNWTDFKWNSGQDAFAVFGRENGIAYDPASANDFVIGGGSQVLYLAGPGGVDSDFRLNSSTSGGGPTSGTIKQGASLEIRTEVEPDGLWTEWDGDLTLDNGTLKRTFQAGGTANTSGAIMFGSWNTGDLTNHEIDVTLKNGGRFENHGMVMLGAWLDNCSGLKVNMTINNGFMDLTGGDTFVLNDTPDQNADLHFYYGTNSDLTPKAESYVINFTGPGSITVDHAGIRVHQIGADYSTWDHEAKTYEQLWQMGILRANGQSGLTGATFGNYFTTTGSSGMDDYTLTSLVTAGVPGDYNNNGMVDAADYVLWRNGTQPLQNEVAVPVGVTDGADYTAWRARFGNTSGSGSAINGAAVPEPISGLLLIVGVMAVGALRQRCGRKI